VFDPRPLPVLLIALALGACRATPTVPAARPNVLFIAVDDLRPELGCYGATHAITPHIDRLAASGMVFTQAHCQQAVCNPSRASVMTGLRPETLGVLDLRTDFRSRRPDAVTVAQHFVQHGYRSWAIGKIFHNTLPDPGSWSDPKTFLDGWPFDPDAVYREPAHVAALEARQTELTAAGREARHIDRFGHWYLKHVATEAPEVDDAAYYDGAQADHAVEKLAELAATGQPFFAAVGFYRPHLPFNAPKRYWDLYDRDTIPMPEHPEPVRGAPPMAINTIRELRGYADFRDAPTPDQGPLPEAQIRELRHGYLASVSYVDAQIGKLLDALDRLDLAADTVVVLWSDHGWKLGDHQSFCKMTNYEIDTRVPLIVRAPGRGPSGARCDALVELVDLYPTLAELCGLPARAGLDGQSFAPLLAEPMRPFKDAVFSVFLREGIWVAADGIEYFGRAVRTARHRYVEWTVHESGAFAGRELYDHAVDPGETVNVAERPENRAVVASLAARLRPVGRPR
jgi:arylsulfatase A-like enzyme